MGLKEQVAHLEAVQRRMMAEQALLIEELQILRHLVIGGLGDVLPQERMAELRDAYARALERESTSVLENHSSETGEHTSLPRLFEIVQWARAFRDGIVD